MKKQTAKPKHGILKGDINLLKPNEKRAVEFLLDLGIDVKIIPPSRERKTPDFWIEHQRRELKTPEGKSPHNIEHAFKKAAKQAEHIIFDARKSPKTDVVFVNEVVKALQSSATVKDVWIILKSGELKKISRREARKLARKEA